MTAPERLSPMPADWLVCDMDQGVLRRERTRKAALTWVMGHAGANHVFQRDSLGPGAYEYRVGSKGDPYDASSWFIERADRAERAGFAGLDRPLYPYVDRPYEEDSDVAADLDKGEGRSWGPDR